MESFVVFIMAIALASALGSGPYLPSGWKPKGPAFLLPAEIEVTSETSHTEEASESEASGSDFLQEYGPPEIQNIYQAVTKQELPDLFTEKAFAVNVAKEQNVENAGLVRSNLLESVDDNTDQVKSINAVTEEAVEVTEKIEEIVIEEDESDTRVGDETPEINVRINTETDSVKVTTDLNETVDDTLLGVVSEEITKTNNNVVAFEAKSATVKGSESVSLSPAAVDEPVGFREYGPPRNPAQGEGKSESERTVGNSARRRRFSSKFATWHKH